MGREIKRVSLDFVWPQGMVWKGYINPYHSQECSVCDGSGYSAETVQIEKDWYDFANTGRKWCYKLEQVEVDALVEAGRLRDLTHKFTPGAGWVRIEPPPNITPEMVNAWARSGMRHDAINRWICVEARAKARGVWGNCPVCDGDGEIWFSAKVKELSEAWWEGERYDPPAGEGWQVWETVTEGSPVSPVFATAEELIAHLVDQGHSQSDAERFVRGAGWVPSLMAVGGKVYSDIETAGFVDGNEEPTND